MVQNVWEKTAGNLKFVENLIILEGVKKQLSANVLVQIYTQIHVTESCYSNVTGLCKNAKNARYV